MPPMVDIDYKYIYNMHNYDQIVSYDTSKSFEKRRMVIEKTSIWMIAYCLTKLKLNVFSRSREISSWLSVCVSMSIEHKP